MLVPTHSLGVHGRKRVLSCICEICLVYYVIGPFILNILFANKAYLVVSSGNPNKMTTPGNNSCNYIYLLFM